MTEERRAALKEILEGRRREILADVHGMLRDAGQQEPLASGADLAELAEMSIQEDIERELVRMKAEVLTKIREALARLEQGSYGYCFECGKEIFERRLRALPFAVRCKDCEEARELALQHERILAYRRAQNASHGLFEICG